MNDLVIVERQGAVALVTLNRPEAMNALSRALRAALHDAIRGLDADPGVRAIVLTGAGERAFTAGLDLKELSTADGMLASIDETGAATDPVRAVSGCRKPVIAAVNGVAITGGFELALACDLIIASTSARFADTHVRVGVIPGWGLSQRLSRAIGIGRAKLLSLTGNFLDAETAERWGLVAMVVPPDRLREVAISLAQDMASAPEDMVQGYKRLIDDGFALDFGAAMALEHQRSSAANATLDAASIEARRSAVQTRGRAQ
ncbi:enoyl-CoA hydratase [Sphingomonas sp. CGMCC 1.13654]|uniref:Enoyl-CoA hydratase n=1 Tax=Sphingomonas chungangi TaxID=2683589 RepID=A0A838L3Z5_9SPHN|nr:enoyl-CoA hydratase [Sphingomonas chungangi]MVW55098.1 enoyl-CoA hydratase [Sphingomonas chungangi]